MPGLIKIAEKQLHTPDSLPQSVTAHAAVESAGANLEEETTTADSSEEPAEGMTLRFTALEEFIMEDLDAHPPLMDVLRLLERLFPDDVLPVRIKDLYMAIVSPECGLWDNERKQWIDGTPSKPAHFGATDEERQATFLNRITKRIYDACSANGVPVPQLRRWTAKWSDGEPVDNPIVRRRPQLSLVAFTDPKVAPEDVRWEQVLVSAAVRKLYEPQRNDYSRQLIYGSWVLYAGRDDRRFHVRVAFLGDHVELYAIDRAGIVQEKSFNIHEHPARLVYLLAALALVDASYLGMDTSITTKDGKRYVEVLDQEYEIVETIHQSAALHGNGTYVWRALSVQDGREVVIKSVWQDEECINFDEATVLEQVNVEGVPQMISNEPVYTDGQVVTTSRLRDLSMFSPGTINFETMRVTPTLMYTRIVMTPYAKNVATFTSVKELLNVFIDAVEAHGRLLKLGILHADISVGNIMIYQPETPAGKPKPRRRGMLIDLDQARQLDEDGVEVAAVSDGGGTQPFVAIEVLFGGTPHPRPHHDLESFLYVLIYLCWKHASPTKVLEDADVMKNGRERWDYGSRDDTAFAKRAHMRMNYNRERDLFDKVVLSAVTEYMADLKPCLTELRELMFGRGPRKATHAEFLEVLKSALKKLSAKQHRAKKAKNTPPNASRSKPSATLGAHARAYGDAAFRNVPSQSPTPAQEGQDREDDKEDDDTEYASPTPEYIPESKKRKVTDDPAGDDAEVQAQRSREERTKTPELCVDDDICKREHIHDTPVIPDAKRRGGKKRKSEDLVDERALGEYAGIRDPAPEMKMKRRKRTPPFDGRSVGMPPRRRRRGLSEPDPW